MSNHPDISLHSYVATTFRLRFSHQPSFVPHRHTVQTRHTLSLTAGLPVAQPRAPSPPIPLHCPNGRFGDLGTSPPEDRP